MRIGSNRGRGPVVDGLESRRLLSGSIAGTLYTDTNGNGKQDGGEAGLAGQTVYLDANHNGKLDSGEKTATTSGTGAYKFTGLAAGTYVVGQVVPGGGYKQTTVTAGGKVAVPTLHDYELNGNYKDADGGPSLVTVGGGSVSSTGYTFAAGQGLSLSKGVPVDNYSIEMLVTLKAPGGYQKLIDFKTRTADAGVYALNGTLVFYDGASGTGTVFTAGEAVDIVLTRSSSTKVVTAYANGTRAFTFTDTGSLATFSGSNAIAYFLLDDLATNHEYASGFLDRLQVFSQTLAPADVAAVDAGGYTVGTGEYVVTLGSSTNATGISFGDQKTVTNLKGTVYVDANGNGTKDSGEAAIAGAVVYLDANHNGKLDSGEVSQKTLSDGSYDFVGLAAGSYDVAVVANTGYAVTQPKATGSVLSHDYALAGKLTDALAGPSLVGGGGTVSSSAGYTFAAKQGLSLSGGLTSDNYSIELQFKLSDVSGYRKIIDFKNRTADAGLYVDGGSLVFYGADATGSAVIADNKAVDVILTRNASTKTVVGYVNGVQQFSFVDASALATFSATGGVAWFFDDDLVTDHEYGAGTVRHVRTFAGPLSAAQAKTVGTGGAPPVYVPEYPETLAAGQTISGINFGEKKIT